MILTQAFSALKEHRSTVSLIFLYQKVAHVVRGRIEGNEEVPTFSSAGGRQHRLEQRERPLRIVSGEIEANR
jgi:hypothetical protein